MKNLLKFSTIIALVMLTMACPNNSDPTPASSTNLVKSSAKDITKFTSEDGVDFAIDETGKLIIAVIYVAGDLDIQNVFSKPTILVSDKATISPASGVKQDFINPIKYTVTAEDGSTKVYTAQVLIYNIPGDDKTSSKISQEMGNTILPQKLPFTYLVSSVTSLFTGVWNFKAGLGEEVASNGRTTFLYENPTTQTVHQYSPSGTETKTSGAGKFGYTTTLKSDKTYTFKDELGDTGSGKWDVVDLGKTATYRYALKLDGTVNISGGPSASGVTTWYIMAATGTTLTLQHEPSVTPSATTYLYVSWTK